MKRLLAIFVVCLAIMACDDQPEIRAIDVVRPNVNTRQGQAEATPTPTPKPSLSPEQRSALRDIFAAGAMAGHPGWTPRTCYEKAEEMLVEREKHQND